MIPRRMEAYLRERLDERTWQNRLICLDDCCFMEFSALDVDRLSRLGIGVDALGPRLVVCMWNAKSPLEIGGYLVVDNLAMGRPSIGGIRMMPDVTPSSIYGLARCMTLKNAAANLPFGGGKVGIVADRHLTPEMHSQVVRGFAPLLRRYTNVFLPGPDVGTDDADMRTIAIENGLDTALSKPMDMGGSRVDEVGAAAGGLVIALEALLEEMPRLTALPQFASLKLPYPSQLTVLIQVPTTEPSGGIEPRAVELARHERPISHAPMQGDVIAPLIQDCQVRPVVLIDVRGDQPRRSVSRVIGNVGGKPAVAVP